jgi:hypothetical protein
MNSSKDIIYSVTEEIGADISYVRTKHGEVKAAYFTGIELGILFGGTVLANFLIGMLKGAIEELSKSGGKKIGQSLATKLIEKLTPIARQTQFRDADTKRINRIADTNSREIDAVRTELLAELTQSDLSGLIDAQTVYERREIAEHLTANGFTSAKVTVYSERLVQRIQRELKDE